MTAEDKIERKTSRRETELDAFVYHISHDVRASMRALTVVPGWIEEDLIAESGGIPGAVKDHIELLTVQAKRLDQMMLDLLAFSRVGRMQDTDWVDLNDALNAMLETDPLPSGFRLIRQLEEPRIFGGTCDLLTLMDVLIRNAYKHHDRKTGEIIISSRREGGDILLSVKDDGPGIEPRFMSRIFELMATLRPRDEVDGSGMGLAIARKIMQQHDGEVWAVSEPDERGTEFIARFPQKSDK